MRNLDISTNTLENNGVFNRIEGSRYKDILEGRSASRSTSIQDDRSHRRFAHI